MSGRCAVQFDRLYLVPNTTHHPEIGAEAWGPGTALGHRPPSPRLATSPQHSVPQPGGVLSMRCSGSVRSALLRRRQRCQHPSGGGDFRGPHRWFSPPPSTRSPDVSPPLCRPLCVPRGGVLNCVTAPRHPSRLLRHPLGVFPPRRGRSLSGPREGSGRHSQARRGATGSSAPASWGSVARPTPPAARRDGASEPYQHRACDLITST